jgi:hypothetical protein
MNELEFIKNLAANATTPMNFGVNVTGRVLADIASRKPKDVWVFPVAAAVSVAAAVVIALTAFYFVQSGDPFADMMSVTVNL